MTTAPSVDPEDEEYEDPVIQLTERVKSPLLGTGQIKRYSTPGRKFLAAMFPEHGITLFTDGSVLMGDESGPMVTTVTDLPGLLAEIQRIHKEVLA